MIIQNFIEYYVKYSKKDDDFVIGYPTGVLEAQAMENSVITTCVTGCCGSIVDGLTGLFANNDAEDIARKINRIRNASAINGENGRRWVEENFDSHIIWKEIEDRLYKD